MIAGISSEPLPAPAPAAAAPLAAAAEGAAPPPFDATAETPPDMTSRLAEALSRNAVLVLMAQQTEQMKLQLRLDRIKAHFNAAQEERAEMLREMNALRDMALEQSKKDDEVLKKYIAQI